MDFSQTPDDLPPTKPYLLRAIWEWCNDYGYTPYMAVEVDASCRVPMEFVKDGQIVLNIGAEATHKLQIANDFVTFQARFGGIPRDLRVPIARVAAIYSRENGVGMAFEVDDMQAGPSASPMPTVVSGGLSGNEPDAPDDPKPTKPKSGAGRPHLQRIK